MALNPDILNRRKKLSHYFAENPQIRLNISLSLSTMSHASMITSLYEEILEMTKQKVVWVHHFLLFALILSIALSIVIPNLGVGLLGFVLTFNLMVYFLLKINKKSNLNAFHSLVSASDSYHQISKWLPEEFIDEKLDSRLKRFRRGKFVREENTNSEINLLLELIFGFTHLNFIYYYVMLDFLKKRQADIHLLFQANGEIELSLLINNLVSSKAKVCEPVFISDNYLEIKAMVHPLVNDCVSNDVIIDRSMLVTGSNASGKSTFLKGCALNIVSVQTLGYCFSETYQGPFYKVISSMALNDQLKHNESYFMVKIRSLNRIMNADSNDGYVFGFIDEILRGTNTIERIAASSAILRQLVESHKRFMVSTHDIELTKILEDEIENVHFREPIINQDIQFDYLLRKGPSCSSNAIKLLEMNGYDPQIVSQAYNMVDYFLKNSQWL